MRDRLRRIRPRSELSVEVAISSGSWEALESPTVVACHPLWRGVRTASHAFREPVIEATDFTLPAAEVAERLAAQAVRVIVVSGFPEGSDELIRACRRTGLETRLLLHSSMTQHGSEPGEAEVVSNALSLLDDGALGRLGFVKAGMAEALQALGYPASWVPVPLPVMPDVDPLELVGDPAIGVFAEPFWRKNVVTQLAAVALIPEATGHVLQLPDVEYLRDARVVAHGVLPRERFIQLQSSVDLNLYVTLSECQPLTPVESYLAGVPTLMSPTSVLFRSDPELWELTTIQETDNPVAIAAAAHRLLATASEAVDRARDWLTVFDVEARQMWQNFTGSG